MSNLPANLPPLNRETYLCLLAKLTEYGANGEDYSPHWQLFTALEVVDEVGNGWSLSYERYTARAGDPDQDPKLPGATWDFSGFLKECSKLATALMQPACFLLGLPCYPQSQRDEPAGVVHFRWAFARGKVAKLLKQVGLPSGPGPGWLLPIYRYGTGKLGHGQAQPAIPLAESTGAAREAVSSGKAKVGSVECTVAGPTRASTERAMLGAYVRGLRTRLRWIGLKGFAPAGQRDMLYRDRWLVHLGRDSGEVAEEDSAPSRGAVTSGKQAGRLSEAVLLEQLRNPPKGLRMCILGEAGTGKSTLLEQLAWDLVGGELAAPEDVARVPFLASLKGWNPACPAALEDLIAAQAPGVPAQLVRDLCIAGRVVCLLDGLDEIRGSADDRRTALEWLDVQAARSDLQSVPLVVAGRPVAFDGMLLRQFRQRCWQLEALDEEDAKGYISNYFAGMPDRAAQLLEQMRNHAAVRSSVAKPLFLMLLCFQCRTRTRPVPANEAELLEGALHEMLDARGLPAESGLRLLGEIAWSCWCSEADGLTEGQVQRVLRVEPPVTGWAGLWDRVRQGSGILMRDGQLWRFAEFTYLKYLAGRHLAYRDERDVLRTFGARVWHPRWAGVIEYMVDCLWQSNRRLATRLVEWLVAEMRAGKDDWWGTLALRCATLLRAVASPSNLRGQQLVQDVAECVVPRWRWLAQHSYCLADQPAVSDAICAVAALEAGDPLRALKTALLESATASRASAVLARLGTSAAREILVEGLAHGGTLAVRVAAAQGLAHFAGDPNSIAALRIALTDPAPEVRTAAAVTLGQLRAKEAVAALLTCASDPDACVRTCVTRALGELGEAAALPAIVAALWDSEDEVQAAAAAAAGEFDRPQVIRLVLKANRDLNRHVAGLLANLGSEACIAKLIAFLNSEGESRIAAIEALAHACGPAPLRALIGVVTDTRESESDAVVLAIESLVALVEDRDAAMSTELSTSIVAALRDPCRPEEVREQAATALGQIGGDGAVEIVGAALHDTSFHVRRAAVIALGRIGGLGAAQALVAALEDDHKRIHVEAGIALMRALGHEPEAAIRRLLLVAQKAHGRLRCNVIRVLGCLGDRANSAVASALPSAAAGELATAVAGLTVAWLATVLTAPDASASRESAVALAKIRSPAAIQALLAGLGRTDVAIRQRCAWALGEARALECVPALTQRLVDDEDDGVRWQSARALGRIGDARAWPALARLVQHPDKSVRYEATLAFSRLADPDAEAALVACLEDPDPDRRCRAIEALGRIRSRAAAPRLAQLLEDPDKIIRRAAAQALAGVVPPQAIDTLMRLVLQDECYHVRIAAAEALGSAGSERAVDVLLRAASNEGCQPADQELEDWRLRDTNPTMFEIMTRYHSSMRADVGAAAAGALARIGTEAAIEGVIRIRLSADDRAGFNSVRALVQHSSPLAVRALVRVAGDGHSWAVHVLEEYCEKQGETILASGMMVDPVSLVLDERLCPPMPME